MEDGDPALAGIRIRAAVPSGTGGRLSGLQPFDRAPLRVRVQVSQEEEPIDLLERPSRVAFRQTDDVADQHGGVRTIEPAGEQQAVGLLRLDPARQEIRWKRSRRRGLCVVLIGELGGFAHRNRERQVRRPSRGRARTACKRPPGQRPGPACAASIRLSRHLRNLRVHSPLYRNSRFRRPLGREPWVPARRVLAVQWSCVRTRCRLCFQASRVSVVR